MDKTFAAVYAVTRNDRKTLPSHQSTPIRQEATTKSKPIQVKILYLVSALELTITAIKETLLNKVK